jgi:hypothetical protein
VQEGFTNPREQAKSPCTKGFEAVTDELGGWLLPDILARTGYGHGMAPVRVRGCVGVCELPGTPGRRSGKPMPGAGETAHVRRLFVDRSRCALEVSPAPRRVQMSLMTGRRAVVAIKSGDTLSRRMWGRRPGRPDGWHPIVRGFANGEPPETIPSRPRRARPAVAPGDPWFFEGRSVPSVPAVLSPTAAAFANRAPGARDDTPAGGYTHLQPSRAPHRTGAPAEGG